ncbi:argininosuccinate lyase [Anopheles sinensis]|uniref:Argininosuccinate lyase n=1 Tax=Anopheles sinensis TaxID=74873 RepID=A0A084VMZ5_ANOSI|nr:argininosuccinate lyase [Anopheles sinensis]
MAIDLVRQSRASCDSQRDFRGLADGLAFGMALAEPPFCTLRDGEGHPIRDAFTGVGLAYFYCLSKRLPMFIATTGRTNAFRWGGYYTPAKATIQDLGKC